MRLLRPNREERGSQHVSDRSGEVSDICDLECLKCVVEGAKYLARFVLCDFVYGMFLAVFALTVGLPRFWLS